MKKNPARLEDKLNGLLVAVLVAVALCAVVDIAGGDLRTPAAESAPALVAALTPGQAR